MASTSIYRRSVATSVKAFEVEILTTRTSFWTAVNARSAEEARDLVRIKYGYSVRFGTIKELKPKPRVKRREIRE